MIDLNSMVYVFEQIRIGGDRNFAYLIGDRKEGVAMVVDPAYQPKALVERAQAQSLKITHIVNTHGHPDHVNGNDEARKLTGAVVAAFKEADPEPDLKLEDNSRLKIGNLTLRFLHTPGHAQDHLVIYIRELESALTGDLLFVGKVGGTQSEAESRLEWDSLDRFQKEVPDHTLVWPGHDYGCRPASTLRLERKSNPFLCCRDLDSFLKLKQEWARFKSDHGLL